jgi:acetyl-CoA decarbonylase/synthase complex subunit gamma
VLLGVSGPSLDSIYDTITALEGLGNKNLIIDVGAVSTKEAFANAVQLRRAALKDGGRSAGYPVLVNAAKLAPGDRTMQLALASLFTVKYGSIIVLEGMNYAEALPLYGLRQNIFTDPQKPMKVEPGIYPINGADENAICAATVDFALTYFIVSGELERSGVPVNLLIPDAGGYSVLTAWAAGKLSASSIARFFKDQGIEGKIKNRNLLIPGKVAVLKGELEENLPGWKIIVAPNEAVGLVRFLKELTA